MFTAWLSFFFPFCFDSHYLFTCRAFTAEGHRRCQGRQRGGAAAYAGASHCTSARAPHLPRLVGGGDSHHLPPNHSPKHNFGFFQTEAHLQTQQSSWTAETPGWQPRTKNIPQENISRSKQMTFLNKHGLRGSTLRPPSPFQVTVLSRPVPPPG